MRADFVGDSELASISAGIDAKSATMLLEKSLFGSHIGNAGNVSSDNLVAVVENGRLDALKKTADLVRASLSECFGLVFSRLELEQLKSVVRHISLPTPVFEHRPALLRLSEAPEWTQDWTKYRGISDLKSALTKLRHPFANGVEPGLKGAALEFALERFYFGAYLPEKIKSAPDARCYFEDMNDVVNLHAARVMDGHGTGTAEKYFVAGWGRIKQKGFSTLCSTSGPEFNSLAGSLTSLKIKYRHGAAGFARALLREYMVKWRVTAIVNPLGIMDILVFIEELNTQASNLKLAIYAGAKRGLELEPQNYFVPRRVA
jgi:hypothetical protein